MPRIPDDELARLKREVPLADLCRDYGIELKQTGPDNLMGCCPFHDDREPSLGITPSKNLWNCLAGCGGGDNLQFVMRKETISFRHAVEILQRKLGVAPLAPVLKTRQGTEHPVLVDPAAELADSALLKHVADFYHQTFCNDPKAMKYLEARRCFHPEAVKVFKLGYANRTLGYRVPATTAEGRKLKEQLTRLGILRESGHEHFTGCVLFPIFNAPGGESHGPIVTEIYGRRIVAPVRNAVDHLYLPGPHAGVWNAAALGAEWLLCEAALDALSFWAHDARNVTWSYGVNGFTPDHWALLRERRPERIVIAYDNDDAGNAAANALAQALEPAGVAAWRVELPPRSDVNDLVRSTPDSQAAREKLASLLAGAKRLLPHTQVNGQALPGPNAPDGAKPAQPAQNGAASASTLGRSHAPTTAFQVVHEGRQADYTAGIGDLVRSYRARGLEHNTSFDQLKVNVRVQYKDRFHLDSFDLYNARSRAAFVAAANQATGLGKETLEADLLALVTQLETHQAGQIFGKLKVEAKAPVMSPEDEARALSLLREPKIFERILADFAIAGAVGEESNKLAGYLIAVSRLLDEPLAGLIMARSAAGKSSLLNAILDFVPEEEKQLVTAMTGQALYYLPEDGLKHKVLAVVEDEGSDQASYPLKILQSEKQLVLAVTVRDPDGGMPQTKLKKVDGPVAQFMTSTQPELDYELANRYLVLSVDEDRQQTQRIHAAQREAETLRGLLRQLDRQAVLRAHHHAQRLLRPLRVVNPFADRLTFPDDRLRLRRDHKKYLGLIRTIAFLRQYQKPIRSCEHRGQALQYIEVDAEDLRLAHELAAKILGRSLDELAPPTRSFLLALHELAGRWEKERSVKRAALRFTRREVQEQIKWSVSQVREHLQRLVDLEYVIVHRVPGTGIRYQYELVYDGQGRNGEPFIHGLRPDGPPPESPPSATTGDVGPNP